MTAYVNIYLPGLPAPTVVESLDYETLLAASIARVTAAHPEYTDALTLDSEPMSALLQEFAAQALILQQRVNEAATSGMLAYSTGSDLDQLVALVGVQRQVVDPGDADAVPPIAPTYESDARLRDRAQLAWEGSSTAGPVGSYIFHALSSDVRVIDVDAIAPTFGRWDPTPEALAELPAGALVLTVLDDVGLADPLPGDVAITVLSTEADGTPSQDLLDAVAATISAEDTRPLTDRPRVRAAEIVPYTITAELTLYAGPDEGVVLAAAEQAGQAYAAATHHLGHDVTVSGWHAALHRPGVQRVSMDFAADLVIESHQAAYCTALTVTVVGRDV